jgi:nitrite reductase (NO-forming) / hydroxylamine reductase
MQGRFPAAVAFLLFPLLLTACGEGSRAEAELTAAHPGQALFDRSCLTCHTIGGGDGIGPDLEGVHQRRPHAWLVDWIEDPMGMAERDELARQVASDWPNAAMPPMGLSRAEIEHVLDYMAQVSEGRIQRLAAAHLVELDEAEFARAGQIYFNRCAGCHGTLRTGATGPNIEPEVTRQRGTESLQAILRHGLPGGMPAWVDAGILAEEEVVLLATFVQMPPPSPPQRPLAEIRDSWNLMVPVASRPARPETRRNWDNFVGVILRDAGQVAILDGDTKELVSIVETGFAVHILRSSSTGRYFYAVGRDGRVSLIDLWTPEPTLVAQVQGCTDARSVDGSKFAGFEDRYLVEGCYWPPQYVVFDGLTLEPLTTRSVEGSTFDTNEPLDEVRIAAIVASHHDPVWVMGLKESGHVGIVDYSQPDFPMVSRIAAERFLHDGGWDHSGRYFLIAANMRNQMAVVDVQEQKLVTTFETGTLPHPGRGANWQDPEYGWVNATVHIGEPLLSVYGADPASHPQHAWQVVRRVTLESAGSLFLKTHPNSPWVWMDMTMSNEPEMTRRVCVYSKEQGELHRCWAVSDHGAVVHFEYNKAGDEVWVSVWDREGELVIYDDASLTEKHRLTGDWLVTPTGKFNVYNTANDIY